MLLSPRVQPVSLLNPLSPDMAEMRTTLAGTMIDVLSYNLNRKNTCNKLFEIGKTYEIQNTDSSIIERDVLGILVEGDWFPSSWQKPALETDYFIVKGLLEFFARALGNNILTISQMDEDMPIFESGSISVNIGESIHGHAGKINGTICNQFDLKGPVYFIELNISEFLNTVRATPSFSQLPRFPAVLRDFCFVMPDSVQAGAIAAVIKSISP